MSSKGNEIKEFFNSMSDEELAKILKEFGFEKNRGDGEVIFTDDERVI